MLELFEVFFLLFFTYATFTKVRSLPDFLQCHDIGETDSDIRLA